MWIRLRQICVACTDLNEVSRDLAGVLGLDLCNTLIGTTPIIVKIDIFSFFWNSGGGSEVD